MTDKHDLRDDVSDDEKRVSEIYQKTAQELPPESVDAAVLALARQQANASIKRTRKPWLFPSSVAASIMVVVVAYFSIDEQDYGYNRPEVASVSEAPVMTSVSKADAPQSDVVAAAAEKRAIQQQVAHDTAREKEAMMVRRASAEESAKREAAAYKMASSSEQDVVARKVVEERKSDQSADSVALAENTAQTGPSLSTSIDAPEEIYKSLLDLQRQLGKSHQEIMVVIEEETAKPDVSFETIQPLMAETKVSESEENLKLLDEYKMLQTRFYQMLLIEKQKIAGFELLEKYLFGLFLKS